MAEFWEENFIEKQKMWGFDPAKSAIIAKGAMTYGQGTCISKDRFEMR